MQILAIDLGTETIPALALGAEPPAGDIISRRPHRGGGLIDKALLIRGYVFLGLISLIGVLFVYFYVLYSGGWKWGLALPMDSMLARQASTATFLGIVIMQVANAYACRSNVESAFRPGFFSNRLLVVGVLVELALTAFIVYNPFCNRLFSTARWVPGYGSSSCHSPHCCSSRTN